MPLSKVWKELVCECFSFTKWKSYSKESKNLVLITTLVSIVGYLFTKWEVNNSPLELSLKGILKKYQAW